MKTFLLGKTHKPTEIFRKLCEVYGNNITTQGGVRQWPIKFKNGRINVRKNRRFTITELSLSLPRISSGSSHEIVTEKLSYHKCCARGAQKTRESAYCCISRSNRDWRRDKDQTRIQPNKLQSMEWRHTNSPKNQENVCER